MTDTRTTLLGTQYVDPADSGDLVIQVIDVSPQIATDVIVHPLGTERAWPRSASVVQQLVEEQNKPFEVWYHRRPTYRDDPSITLESFQETHVKVRTAWAKDRDDVYNLMQGERWSPHGEARPLIAGLGLGHTTMSVGDILVDTEGTHYVCESLGWRKQ